MIKSAVILWILVALFASQSHGADYPGPVKHPAKPGEYLLGDWSYTYVIRAPGTRSESRIGRLFYKGKEVKGEMGNVLTTSLGKFVCFSDPDKIKGWNSGWLMTLTYDTPVWDANGKLTEDFSRNSSSFVKLMKEVELQDVLRLKD